MNLISMLFLFMCVVGFDHFYRGVMTSQQNELDVRDAVQLSSPEYQKISNNTSSHAEHNHKIAKLQ